MDFIDGDRGAQGIPLRAGIHPGFVVPGEIGEVAHDRGGAGTKLAGTRIGVCLGKDGILAARSNLILVEASLGQVREEELPEPRRPPVRHRVATAIPAIEFTHDADARGIRRPDDEMYAGDSFCRANVCAQGFIGSIKRAFRKQV